ncbi:WD40 repeat domain-containing protein [Flavilitoribacter nigricans]|uniref:Uncharacterized protein n=1 Tax=Flavilitoribacter nigricans (strain ATCC 23147 / DSM 23189 / NBRC 102662 / NCIMB 1420 / SS-2) TaxID=1122177 RepID=A0A2D0NG80_FLAN2|nr:WD40 repeat domain-containing protein [Flavilitoribacter nigricans]PHN07390.1 hypothetical protein CRP01_07105 [Flavilitoribacter nigricans DSM 23189 = NBRC 102662]
MPSKTNPDITSDTSNNTVTFDLPLIQKTGGIGDVLVELMNNQIRKIKSEIRQELKSEKIPPKSVERILNGFVSLEGTKQPRHREELQYPELSEILVATILTKLVDARLLRESDDGVYELVHDTLAAHIEQTRDQADIAIDETVKMVKDAYYFQDKTNRYLSEDELNQLDKYSETIQSTNRLTKEEWKFVKKSKRKEQRRTLRMRAVFFLALGIAVLMSVLYVQVKQTERENQALLGEIGVNLEQLKNNKQLTQATAEALRNSRNDRTRAFLQLRDVQQNAQVDSANNALVGQLTNNFLSEFSLFPFYNLGERLSETIDEVIVEDSLKFILGAAMDSPVPFFKNLKLPDDQLRTSIREKGFLIPPKDFNKYGKIRDMVLLQDGKTVISGHADGKIWKWQVTNDTPPQMVYEFKQGRVREMIVVDNSLLVGVDSIIYELNLRRKKPYAEFLIGFNRPIKLLVGNPRNRAQYAVVKENSNKIFICDRNSKSITQTVEVGLSTVTSMAFSPNGRKMIAAFEEGDVAKLWDLRYPQLITEFKGHRALISTIAFSPDGRKILTGSWDQSAILWTYKGEIIKRLVGHEQRIHSVAYTANNYAVTCSEDGDIKTWFLAPLAERDLIFEDSVRALAVSPMHDTIAFSLYGDKGFFHLWHWPSDQRDTVWQPIKRFDRPGDIVALAYASDGKGIVAASENTLTTFIDRSGRNQNEDYRGGGYARVPSTSSIAAVDVNDDYVLIVDRKSGKVLLRDRKDPAKFKVLDHPNRVHAAKFSPDNHYVLSGCEDGDGYLWDLRADSLSRRLEGHTSKVVAVDFSPDGRYLLTGSYDNTALLFELQENRKGNLNPTFELEGISASYRGHTSDINAVAFANELHDGTYRFTTAGADKVGKIWELTKDGSLHERPSLIRHLDEVTVTAFLRGDSLIVTGGFDETLKVWRADGVGALIDERVLPHPQ